MDVSEASRVELTNLLQSLSAKIGSDHSADLQREADRHIEAMHDAMKRIVKSGYNDVFAHYLLEKLEALAGVCVEAAGKGVMRVTEHEFSTPQLLMHALGGKKILRYTWQVTPGQRLFEDEAWRRHFELTSSLAMSGDIEIRALMIVPDRSACDAAQISRLLGFFATQENMAAKVVVAPNWNACVIDYGVAANCIEFGVYGANLLYRANSYTPVSVGSWSKDAIDIERYTRFFDSVWNSSAMTVEHAASGETVRLSQVMAADAAVERREAPANTVRDSLVRIEERMKADVA